jgi:hypothetical protein
MTAITSDDRVAELIEKVVKFTGGSADSTPTDILVTPMNGASKEYAEWAKLQTLKKDGGGFFNTRPTEGLNAHSMRTLM